MSWRHHWMILLEGIGEYTARGRGSGNLGACACRLFMSTRVNDTPGEKRPRKPHRLALALAQARVETAILPSWLERPPIPPEVPLSCSSHLSCLPGPPAPSLLLPRIQGCGQRWFCLDSSEPSRMLVLTLNESRATWLNRRPLRPSFH